MAPVLDATLAGECQAIAYVDLVEAEPSLPISPAVTIGLR